MNNKLVLECQDLCKDYDDGKHKVSVFEGIQLDLRAGETAAIVGASGSGKTTLLNLLAGLDLATSGDVLLDGVSWASMKDKHRAIMRNKNLGFVYQFHHLLPEFSALENVMMPMLIANKTRKESQTKAKSLLGQVGLGARLDHRPSQLSGGERQRVAIARALANDPACVLMDEPTGNLDEKTGNEIQALIQSLKVELNMAFLIVTHDEGMLDWMDSAYRLHFGKIQEIEIA
ncbi:ABC transporter [Marinomonas sp. SBI22]|uniref:ABC transporter ATP-binding protein n=1 Tax=unclassified Marinomonas TaxID=196814 RepID=UPI0007AFC0FE|nr:MULTISPECIES: ATP-binding cassette domain-containing protein [unclassified Marinomonas]KZM40501.1 ABC transporter [Marinomonas sp. SBI8L]KZM43592.1 ABC transporter [Marinomonas sp. SBI22]